LLLDGLDEVSESHHRRENLRIAIAEFARNAPQTFIIVTGRPYAYETDKQRLAGFKQADLEPMTEPQIREFIRHWYLNARHANEWDEAMAQKRASQLAEQIFARRYLPEMASTALLLTLFIGLDYAGKRLPSSRAELYREAVGLLLQRWTQNLKDYLPNLEEAERHGTQAPDGRPEARPRGSGLIAQAAILTGVLSDKSKRSQKSPQPSIAQAAKS
jgi:predicted NACHT family NTPase